MNHTSCNNYDLETYRAHSSEFLVAMKIWRLNFSHSLRPSAPSSCIARHTGNTMLLDDRLLSGRPLVKWTRLIHRWNIWEGCWHQLPSNDADRRISVDPLNHTTPFSNQRTIRVRNRVKAQLLRNLLDNELYKTEPLGDLDKPDTFYLQVELRGRLRV
jgi:hypothetical protein